MTFPSSQQRFLFIFIACAALLVTATYIEPFSSMDPCPMCMMQRVFFSGIGLVALIGAIHNAGKIASSIYAFLAALLSVGGAAVAIRQLWLQSLPEDQVPACGPGIDYMLEVFPLLEVIEMALRGTGDCAKVQWTFMSLSIPGWSLLAFICFAIIGLSILFKKDNK
ncbi:MULTISPECIES: disulfide bond formation protein B [unclassified Oleiphilus]|jgi:disulfide bond formation protein DsbB|uniref:disulfide bond formation protein B n=3 Tax=Oleiphilus TaxID=141450 RepID=UPI0007C3353A|nr:MULTISPECIES: disulfide bond formation protein B [unclassified Oleiphilus]KZY51247.1 disulfide bond formation protein DsbB [Oleiphilus sp. HI0050]KZY77689.1 disulfide bond formation protein DsbB [Oleiphilus sp. HI0069]KZY84049.1 disulfide bond formation protein DsbB [Oleiphilus sp. HI0068]KZY87402.1 disulfide bond formation protein DsbB [Oleiphilus sp. HI0072]KZZ09176.1 disulfide bond formation protein DsbB [Oleiphilus sp. HI0078]KZZ20639.1 disulfide bond formation protein DsbB [Oleiphilus